MQCGGDRRAVGAAAAEAATAAAAAAAAGTAGAGAAAVAAVHALTPPVPVSQTTLLTPPGSGASASDAPTSSSASGSSGSSAPAGGSAVSAASGAVSAGSSGLVLQPVKRVPAGWQFLSEAHTRSLWDGYDVKTQNEWASKVKNSRATKPKSYHDPKQGGDPSTDFQGAPIQHQERTWASLTPHQKRGWMIDNGVETKTPKNLDSFHGIKVLHHEHGTTTGTMQAVSAPPAPAPLCDNCPAPATDTGTEAEPMPPPQASHHCPNCGPTAGVNLCGQCCEAIHLNRINEGHAHFEVTDWARVGKRHKDRGVRKTIPASDQMKAAVGLLQPGKCRHTMWQMMKQASSAVAYCNLLATKIPGPRNTFGLIAATSNADSPAPIQCGLNDCPNLLRITLLGEPSHIGSLLSRTSVCTKVKVGIPRDKQSSDPDAVEAIGKYAADDQNFRFADNPDSFLRRITFEESGDDRPVAAAASSRGSIVEAITAVSPSAEGLQPQHLTGVAASDAGQSETNGSSVTTNPNVGTSDSQVLEDEVDNSQDINEGLSSVQEAEGSSSAGGM